MRGLATMARHFVEFNSMRQPPVYQIKIEDLPNLTSQWQSWNLSKAATRKVLLPSAGPPAAQLTETKILLATGKYKYNFVHVLICLPATDVANG